MRKLAATLLAVALITTACGAGVEQNVRYDSVFDLRDAIEATGYECDTFEIRSGASSQARESAECSDAVLLTIFDNATDAKAAAESTAEIVTGIIGLNSVHLIGPNWSINCGDEQSTCEDFQDSLGGELAVAETDK